MSQIEPAGNQAERVAGDFDRDEWAAQEAAERFMAALDDIVDDSPDGKRNRWTHRWFAASRWR